MGPAPKCRRSAFWEGPKKSLQSVLCCTLQTCFGRNRDPKGARNAKQKTECRWAPGSPEAVTEHKTGYKTADTLHSKVVICTRPAEVQRNGGAIRADISSARTAIVDTGVADRKNLIRLLQDAQDTRGMPAEMAEMDIVKSLEVRVSPSTPERLDLEPCQHRRFGRETCTISVAVEIEMRVQTGALPTQRERDYCRSWPTTSL